MKFMIACLSLLIGLFIGNTDGATCTTCIYGIIVEDSSGLPKRFRNTTADAQAAYDGLTAPSVGFTGRNSTEACGSLNACGSNSVCNVTTDTVFKCDCEEYYEPKRQDNQFECLNIDECTTNTHNCSATGGICTDVTPGFSCACDAGFSGDGYNCTNINECASNPCALNATCTETSTANFTCACDSGFNGDGYSSCTDIDECSVNSTLNSCSTNATCTNTGGSHVCTCNTGYTGNGTTCDEIDDCASSPCHADADCTDLLNNYTCVCKTGFSGDGVSLCEKQRGDLNVTFVITCTSLAFISDLQNTSSGEYTNVTNAITAAARTFVTSIDGSAGIADISYSFVNSTDGMSSAETTITILVNNTNAFENDYLKKLDTFQETSECGAQASADECALQTDTCTTDQTCSNTPYGFCCYTDFDFRGTITYNTTFNATMSNITSLAALGVFDDAVPLFLAALEKLQRRGCTHDITRENQHIFEGSTIAVILWKIVNATYTAQDIADEMAKLENTTTSFGTIIGSGDFDECVSQYESVRNCSEFATCTNFIGSFSCECNRTHYDNGNNTSGQLCIAPVTVSCSGSAVNVSVLTKYYEARGVNVTSLHLADYNCNFTSHSTVIGDSHQFEININDCNTTLTSDANSTAIIASNFISNVPAAGVFTGDALNIPFQCKLPSVLNITIGVQGQPSVVNLPDVVTDGEFNLQFGLFDETYTTKKNLTTTTFTSTDTIYGEVKVLNDISGVGVLITECWGTPTNDRNDASRVDFLANGCPTTGFVQALNIARNGDGSARFDFQMFYFTQSNSVFLHCDVSVCTPSCTQTCAKRRRRRSEPDKRSDGATITIQVILDPNDPNFNDTTIVIGGLQPTTPRNGSNINDITLPIVAAMLAFLLILILVVLVVVLVRKQRAKKNDYDITHVNMHAIGVKPPNYEQ